MSNAANLLALHDLDDVFNRRIDGHRRHRLCHALVDGVCGRVLAFGDQGVAGFDNVLTTDQKGAVAELAIARQAAELGIGVWAAHTVERYDLIFDLRPQLVRVQCKWASRYGDVVIALFGGSD